MKKLLIIPIMLMYYLLMAMFFPIEILLICICHVAEFIRYFTERVIDRYNNYLMGPFVRIHAYALDIMEGDKTIQKINEAHKRMKQGKFID